MLREVEPQILHVATPPQYHRAMVEQAVSHNTPLVICEKPLADNLKDAVALSTACDNSQTILMVNHERRYSRDYVYAKGVVQAGIYGRLCSITAKIFMGRQKLPHDVLIDDGTHLIDILRYLTGEEFCVLEVVGRLERERETVQVLCRLGDCHAVLEIAGGRDYMVFEVDLGFEKGRM